MSYTRTLKGNSYLHLVLNLSERHSSIEETNIGTTIYVYQV